MGYTTRRGRRPQEAASKSSHGYIVNDPVVVGFLDKCHLPARASEVALTKQRLLNVADIQRNPISHVIAIDGGYTEIPVRREFPSSTITFFQFGALVFAISDLDEISQCPFIDPEDMEKLKNIQRLKLTMPTKNISFKDELSLISSFRRTLYEFFCAVSGNESLMETLKWFIFKEYSDSVHMWDLATCPNSNSDHHSAVIRRDKISRDYTIECDRCGELLYLTDVFRLHEAIDEEIGAGGVLGYVTTLIEQMILIHLVRLILKTKPSLLKETLFIKDGPLAFFGQTANMHKPMRALASFLVERDSFFLAGLEKSGAFVDHADEISDRLMPGEILLLDNEYIYRYVIPGSADTDKPYARSSYYGGKLIYRSRDERTYVITIPVSDERVVLDPKKEHFRNLDIILHNVEKLKCDMYDSALIPIALVNKLVSLADHPSSVILEKFARVGLGH